MKRLVKISALGLLILMQLSCAQLGRIGDHADALDVADKTFRSGNPAKALKLLNKYLATNDLAARDRGAAHLLLGDIHFSLQRFDRALHHYRTAWAAVPRNYHALQRSWSAMLMLKPGKPTRSEVRTAIRQLLSEENLSTEGLLAAYNGYAYLWDSAGRKKVLYKMMAAERQVGIERDLPYLVMEEMIGSRDSEELIRFGYFLINNHPAHSSLPTVANILFKGPVDPGQRESLVNDLLQRKNLPSHLDYFVTRYLWDSKQDSKHQRELARKRLDNLVNLADNEQLVSCHDPGVSSTCEFYRKLLLARVYTLQSVMLAEANKAKEALRYAHAASRAHPLHGKAWLQLARLQLSKGEQTKARASIVNALNINPDSIDAKEFLQKLNRSSGLTSSDSQSKVKQAAESGVPYFRDDTRRAGLDGIQARHVAWGDINNDGFDDLLVSGPRLLLNQSGRRFKDITKAAGLTGMPGSTGGIFVDFDNDGHLDVLVTGRRTILYRNRGNNRFAAFQGFNNRKPQRTAAASWGDLNGDGYPDVYLANYEKSGSQRSICYPDQLFVNRDGTKFEDASHLLSTVDTYPKCGRGVLWSDFNQDRLPEILISNYRLHPNRLLNLQGGLSFREISERSGIQSKIPGHSIAAVSVDFNGDGLADVYQTNLAHPRYLDFSDTSHLFLNHSNGTSIHFRKKTKSGISFDETNADISVADFDNDGDVDLFITSIYPKRYSKLYLNNGHAYFKDVSWLSGTQVANAWGTANSDFDNDGDVDLLVASEEGIRLLTNESTSGNHFKIGVTTNQCQRNGLGTKVWLKTGARTQYREIQAGKGTGTQDSATLLFGLGDYKGPIEVRALDACGHAFRRQVDSTLRKLIIS